MESFAIYILKVHAAISVLYGVYYLSVSKELFFKLNRIVLLAILFLSFCLPLLPLPDLRQSIPAHLSDLQGRFAGYFSSHVAIDPLEGQEVARMQNEGKIDMLSSFITTLVIIYLSVVCVLLLKFLNQIYNVVFFIRNGARVMENNVRIIDPGEAVAAFSFFNTIVINREQYNRKQLCQILAHERAHVRQWHSIDILLAELVCIFLWCNPFLNQLKNTVRLNLEFLADNEVLKKGFNKKEYQWNILLPYLESSRIPLTNLFSSKPAVRIEKMNLKRNPYKLYKYIFLIPAATLIYSVIRPFHASALDIIYKKHLIENHEFSGLLGYYEFEEDRGSFIQIVMKDNQLIMKTLWNNNKIYFEKQSENEFIDKGRSITLTFPKNADGSITRLVAFGKDNWNKVSAYTPASKAPREGLILSNGSNGTVRVKVYPIGPWEKVKHYVNKNATSSL